MLRVKPQVLLVPLGDLDPRVLHPVAANVIEVFDLFAEIGPTWPLPEAAFDPARGQYRADVVLEEVKRAFPDPARVVVVAAADLYTPGLNFVFGLAEKPGRAAVVAVERLFTPEGRRFFERLMKEVNHELGHTFGLDHCTAPRCVMRFSNSVAEVDQKSRFFCPRCKEALDAAIKALSIPPG